MAEIKTANSKPNIPSHSTLVTLKISDIIPTANHYLTVKAIKNTKLN
jgi:hypothetical protein